MTPERPPLHSSPQHPPTVPMPLQKATVKKSATSAGTGSCSQAHEHRELTRTMTAD